MSNYAAQLPALREWAATCDAVGRGEQSALIRKGGISEGSEGFTVEASRFALLPTLFHQRHGTSDAGSVTVSVICEVVRAIVVPGTTDLSSLAPFHRYDPAQLASRIAYKPERPLTLIAVRPFRVREPIVFPAHAIQPVCRSWLGLPIDPSQLTVEPVVTGADERRLLDAMSALS